MTAPQPMTAEAVRLARLARERTAQARRLRAIAADSSLSLIQSDALAEAARLLEAEALEAARLYMRSSADAATPSRRRLVRLSRPARSADVPAQVVAEGVPELPGFTRRTSSLFCRLRDSYLISSGVLRDLELDTERAPDVREALAAGATLLDAAAMRCERDHADLAAVAALIEGMTT